MESNRTGQVTPQSGPVRLKNPSSCPLTVYPALAKSQINQMSVVVRLHCGSNSSSNLSAYSSTLFLTPRGSRSSHDIDDDECPRFLALLPLPLPLLYEASLRDCNGVREGCRSREGGGPRGGNRWPWACPILNPVGSSRIALPASIADSLVESVVPELAPAR